MHRWAFSVPSEHSDFECTDGHLAFHRSIQISNAQMCIGHSTGAFRFRMHRWAFCIPLEHSDFECTDRHLAIHRSIQISNAQMGIGHSTGAFRFQLVIPREHWALGIPREHSDFECSDVHNAFVRKFLSLNAQMGIRYTLEHSDFECTGRHLACVQRSIQSLNA